MTPRRYANRYVAIAVTVAPTSAAAVTAGPLGVYDDDGEDGGYGGSGIDANDVGAGQLVVGEALEDRPRQTERGAHCQAGQPAG